MKDLARQGCARHARSLQNTHARTHARSEVKGSPPVRSVLVRSVFLGISLFLPLVYLGVERIFPLLLKRENKISHVFLCASNAWPLHSL